MFNIVVFRFPAALPESSYRNIISESKRVLKPGGYLEIAILDLDMLNMGNRARRAVRSLKVRMQVADPSVSLAAASDTVMRLVGKRGFVDVKSCNVGVPVASTVASSNNAPEMSLADLLKNNSPSSDEGITKMVAKVGRWWYTRCYESIVLPVGGVEGKSPAAEERSIWYADGGRLLSECEKRNASFKLVVAYAQKPFTSGVGQGSGSGLDARKRGMSV
jgi:hypothetical protein